MRSYNIYAGLGGIEGGIKYLYTTMCDSLVEADAEAFECACEEYSIHEELHNVTSWEEVKYDYCEHNKIAEGDLTDKDLEAIDKDYNNVRDEWLDYCAIPTDEDDIDQESLILGYVHDSSSSVSS